VAVTATVARASTRRRRRRRARAEAMTSSSPSPSSPTPRECVDDTSPEATTTTTTTAEEETTRSKVVILLAGALGDATPLCDHGAKLERALYVAHGGVSRAYRTRARELVANFKRNVKLAGSVVRGDTSAEDVVTMPVTDLATEEAQVERDRMEERAVRKRTRTHFDDGVNSEAYVCPECGSNQCKYVMLSDSRDVRKAEIWGGSSNDECLALIQCQNCQHEWKTTK